MPHIRSLYPEIPVPPDQLNVYETIAGRPELEEWPDYVMHIEESTGRTRNFKELRKRISDLATALGTPDVQGGLGLRAEDKEMVGILSDNCSDYVVLVLALLKIAIPFSSIPYYATPFELKHALTLSGVTRLFVAPQYLSKTLPVAMEAGVARDNIYVMNSQVKGYKSLDDFVKEAGEKRLPEIKVRIVGKDSIAYLVFSSGTSGLPKGVIISHGNVLFTVSQLIALLQHRAAASTPPAPTTPDGNPVALAFLPMHHVYGLHVYCFRSFLTPTRLVILPRWDVEKVLKAIPKYKVTMLNLVPSMAHQLANHPKTAQTDLSSILNVSCGAAYLAREVSVKLMSQIPNKDVHFGEGYGMSETTVSAILQPFPGSLGGLFKNIPSSSGVLIPGLEARIVRDDGSEADYDEVGELWLKGPNIVSGYWNNPKANETTFVDSWLRTGDKFKIDKDQYFYFADRGKDVLKVSGSQVSPMEIEGVLLAHPQQLISDVTVAGVSGGRTEDEKVPRAWIVLSENGKTLGAPGVIRELQKWHQTNLSKYKWLRGGIEIIKEIPKSPTGKTLRRVLQDQYEEGLKSRAKL